MTIELREKFGEMLKRLRIKKRLSLREVCKLTSYDPSNWSKIERGKISPPPDEKVLKKWGDVLGIATDQYKLQEFIDAAKITQGSIPKDILSRDNSAKCLPVFFRTLRGQKPTKAEINYLIKLIRKS